MSGFGQFLIYAAQCGDLMKVRQLLEEMGADINFKEDNFSALKSACFYGHENVATLLLDRGADINEKDNVSFNAYL